MYIEVKKGKQHSMKKHLWWRLWLRLFLWAYAISVAAFYLLVWRRTSSSKDARLRRAPKDDIALPLGGPTVSIIVPARNEEGNISRCIRSLLEQDYGQYEVIAVDDGSTDGTARVLDELVRMHPNSHHLWVLRLRGLAEGWAGKPHALHMGVQEAQGEWLLFTDADTWHAPDCLRSALAQAVQEHADMFTLSSDQELPAFWDKVLMPMAYLGISMQYPPKLVNNPNSSVAVANGQFILLRRAVYDIIGGYARPDLRQTLLDDRDLARVVKENGFKLRFVDGREVLRVHMYHGLSDIWHGWRKNAYLGSRGGTPFVLLELLGLPAVSIVPFLIPLLVRLPRNKKGDGISTTEANIITASALVPLFVYRLWLNKQLNVPWYYAFTHPIAGAIFEGILGQSSLWIITGKGVDWRGRQYYRSRNGEMSREPQGASSQ